MLNTLLTLPTLPLDDQIKILIDLDKETPEDLLKAQESFIDNKEGVEWYLPDTFPLSTHFNTPQAVFILKYCTSTRYLQESFREDHEERVQDIITDNPHHGLFALGKIDKDKSIQLPNFLKSRWTAMNPIMASKSINTSFSYDWYNMGISIDLFKYYPIEDILSFNISLPYDPDKLVLPRYVASPPPLVTRIKDFMKENLPLLYKEIPASRLLAITATLLDTELAQDYRSLLKSDHLDLEQTITDLAPLLDPLPLATLLLFHQETWGGFSHDTIINLERVAYDNAFNVRGTTRELIPLLSLFKRIPGLHKVRFTVKQLEKNINLIQHALDELTLLSNNESTPLWYLFSQKYSYVFPIFHLLDMLHDEKIQKISMESLLGLLDKYPEIVPTSQHRSYTKSLIRHYGKSRQVDMELAYGLYKETTLPIQTIIDLVETKRNTLVLV